MDNFSCKEDSVGIANEQFYTQDPIDLPEDHTVHCTFDLSRLSDFNIELAAGQYLSLL